MKTNIEIQGVGRCTLEESENQIMIFNHCNENFRFVYHKKTKESSYRSTYGLHLNAVKVKEILISYCENLNT
jgi:hypothetical protein